MASPSQLPKKPKPVSPKHDRPGDCIRHPVCITMLIVWLLNDHVWKEVWGNALTGKLSDIAGLVVFPMMLTALYEFYCSYLNQAPISLRRVHWVSLGFSALIMILINLSEWGADFVRVTLGYIQWPFQCLWHHKITSLQPVQLTEDPTDLWTLVTLIIPYKLLRSND